MKKNKLVLITSFVAIFIIITPSISTAFQSELSHDKKRITNEALPRDERKTQISINQNLGSTPNELIVQAIGVILSFIPAIALVFIAHLFEKRRQKRNNATKYCAYLDTMFFELTDNEFQLNAIYKEVNEFLGVCLAQNDLIAAQLINKSVNINFLSQIRINLAEHADAKLKLVSKLTFYLNRLISLNNSLDIQLLMVLKQKIDSWNKFAEILNTHCNGLLTSITKLNELRKELLSLIDDEFRRFPQYQKMKIKEAREGLSAEKDGNNTKS
ncbi:MAG: hypothetical protein Q8L04_08610 [Ignavibacteria bacterium]|nr:hypothetical protein [Ignavibacteria bacterium]